MRQYLDLMQHVLVSGVNKSDRTGTGTRSVFGAQMRFDFQRGFPLLTTKQLHTKSIVHELLWMLNGDTNIQYLNDNGVRIWDDWADADGNLGPVYGHQWRSWPGAVSQGYMVGGDGLVGDCRVWPKLPFDENGFADVDQDKVVHRECIDQIANVIHSLRTNPDSRRHIVSAWNPADIESMKLPPCHALFQFYTREMTLAQRISIVPMETRDLYPGDHSTNQEELDHLGIPRRYLDCQLYQRSADIFLGVPFNIASYALLTSMIAHVLNMLPGEFIWTGGDCHLYLNHLEQARLQLTRTPRSLPTLHLAGQPDTIFDFKYEDIRWTGYVPHPHIPATVSV